MVGGIKDIGTAVGLLVVVGGTKGMLPLEYFPLSMLMTVGYCGLWQVRRLGEWHMSTLESKVQPLTLEYTGIVRNMMGGMKGALG